jgi:TetR/AcrR family transcriptional repressor of nem operon
MVQKSPRTGRPLEFEPDTVLDSAMRLFWAQGYEATSLELLEQETRLSRSSLYNTFGSKRELFERALTRYLAFLDQQLLGPLETGQAGLTDLDQFVARLGMQLDGPGMIAGCLLTNSLVEFGGHDDEIVRRGHGYVDRARKAIRAALDRAADLGEIKARSVPARAELLVGLVLSINLVARSGLGKETFSALIEAVHAEIAGWRTQAPQG